MQDQAIAELPGFLVRCGEGRVPYGYPDQRGIVTTAIGCAIFDLQHWMSLDWRNPDRSPASPWGKQQAYIVLRSCAAKVIADGPDRWPGGGHYENVTSIRLTDEGIDALVAERAAGFEVDLETWPGWANVPWQAQVGLARVAWATGSHGLKTRFPRLYAAWCARDWATCADESRIPALDETEPQANGLEREMFMACVGA